MRILQLIDSLSAGGAERMAVNISNVLQKSGHEVFLCASREKGPLEKFICTGVNLYTLNKKHAFDIFALIRLLTYVKKKKIEIIHAHSSSVYWAVVAKFIRPSIKIIWHDHYGLSETLRNTDRKGLQFISPWIDGIIAVNDTLRAWSVQNMRVKSKKIVIINNFPLLPERKKQTTPGSTTIVCLANLRPQKDHPTLVKAIKTICDDHAAIRLKVIFAGLYWQDAYYSKLVSLIKSLGLENTIQITGSVEDPSALLTTADVGVLSSVSEGLPVSLLEYGLAGLPVVVTDVGQCAEVVGNGRFGKVVPASDPKKMAEAVFELISKPVEAQAMAARFKLHVESEYGPQSFAKAYNTLLTAICPIG